MRFTYSSMTTPSQTYDYDMATRKKTLLKEDEVLGGFDEPRQVSGRVVDREHCGTSRVSSNRRCRRGTWGRGRRARAATG